MPALEQAGRDAEEHHLVHPSRVLPQGMASHGLLPAGDPVSCPTGGSGAGWDEEETSNRLRSPPFLLPPAYSFDFEAHPHVLCCRELFPPPPLPTSQPFLNALPSLGKSIMMGAQSRRFSPSSSSFSPLPPRPPAQVWLHSDSEHVAGRAIPHRAHYWRADFLPASPQRCQPNLNSHLPEPASLGPSLWDEGGLLRWGRGHVGDG